MSDPKPEEKPTTIIIFGASGDLTQRKLIPALFSLYHKGRLPHDFKIVGFSTSAFTDDEYRATARKNLGDLANYQVSDEDEWHQFASHITYHSGDFTKEGEFERLASTLKQVEDQPCNHLFYLATPPRFFADIVAGLGSAGLAAESDGWRRVVIEKPFGKDLQSARALNEAIHKVLSEKQIYRIDHYLGKETVQNVMVFRFANAIFEPIWNRMFIDHVQITVAEEIGVEHRAGYYDKVGVVRDMFQNHLLQLLTLVAMEPPASFTANDLRNEKVKLLNAVRPMLPERVPINTVRGQYRGYRQEEGVDPNSQTATYAAVRLLVDNWRWQGVPFYLRSGKRLATKDTEISIQFKCPPITMFPLPPRSQLTPNMLALCLQPDEGIHLRFEAKVPDKTAEMRSVDMDFHYEEAFGPRSIPEAYERLVLDALRGDASLFIRNDQIERAWEIVDPIIACFEAPDAPRLEIYEPGSWGPSKADELLTRHGREWTHSCGHAMKKA